MKNNGISAFTLYSIFILVKQKLLIHYRESNRSSSFWSVVHDATIWCSIISYKVVLQTQCCIYNITVSSINTNMGRGECVLFIGFLLIVQLLTSPCLVSLSCILYFKNKTLHIFSCFFFLKKVLQLKGTFCPAPLGLYNYVKMYLLDELHH